MMGMGLLGALSGAAEAVGQVADQSIKNRYEMEKAQEFEKIVAMREERAAALREKYQIQGEERKRTQDAADRADPNNPAYQQFEADKLKLKGAQDADAARYDESKLSIGDKTKLEKERAITKEHEARAGLIGAQRDAGGFRPSSGGAGNFDEKQVTRGYERVGKEVFKFKSPLTGEDSQNTAAQNLAQDAYTRMVDGGVNPAEAQMYAIQAGRNGHNRALADLAKDPKADVELLTKKYAKEWMAQQEQRHSGGTQAAPAAGKDSGTQAGPAAKNAPASGARNRAGQPVKTEGAEDKKATPVKLEKTKDTTLLGGKKFIATFPDGHKEVVSGDEYERMYMLQE